MHFYAYKHWSLFLIGFFLVIGLWFWLCYLPYCANKTQCCSVEDYKKKVQSASLALEECCNCDPNLSIEQNEIDELRRDYGGNIGEITITLAWQTIDDLDLYLVEPSGEIINFENRKSRSGGELDIDKNAGESVTGNPIENIFYASKPQSGKYTIHVHYFGNNSAAYSIPYKVYINIGTGSKELTGTHYNVGEMHTIYELIIP